MPGDALINELRDLSVDLLESMPRQSLVAQLAAERLAEVEDRLARYERYEGAVDVLRRYDPTEAIARVRDRLPKAPP